MCGIVGYIGNKKAAPIIIDGLKRLEYRGYDSAGIAAFTMDGSRSMVTKKRGRVGELEKLVDFNFDGTVAMGHSRWSTHGEPSDTNSHPHWCCENKIFVVHNGIIENYKALKERLIERGHEFRSQTDTEVMAHLVEDILKTGTISFEEAVRTALQSIEGTYAFVVAHKDYPGQLIVAKKSSPLLVGLGEQEFFIASDAAATLPYTNKVIYFDDNEYGVFSPSGYKIHTLDNKPVEKQTQLIEWTLEEATKQGYPHFMLKEIFEEPEAIENATRGRILPEEGLAKLGGLELIKNKLKKINRLVITSCGTAYYAGLVGKYMLEEYAGIPTEIEYASELRYRKPIFNLDTALITVSQSGETADTLAALKEAKEQEILTLGITNTVASSIAREVHAGVYNHAGPEIGVASTKAFVSQVVIFALLTLFLGRDRKMTREMSQTIAREITLLPMKIKKILEYNTQIEAIAEKYQRYKNFLYLGRKYSYPIALEGALKLKEISYIHAEGYGAGEMKHGPIALVDENCPSFFIVPKDSVYDKTLSNMEEIKARKGKIIAVATQGDNLVQKIADNVIYVPETIEMLNPILSTVPLHLFAYHVAVLKGCDVDKPRNLAKSVTVE